MIRKIIILNHGLHISGVPRAMVNFANALAARGYDVTVKLEIDDLTLASQLDDRVKVDLFLKEWRLFGRRLPGFQRFYRWFVRHMYRLPPKMLYALTVEKGYDVEIAFTRGAVARIISASTNKAAKKLVWVHSDFMRCENALAGFASLEDAQRGYGRFDHILCVSAQAEQSFRQRLGDYGTLLIQNNIMDFERICSQAQAFVPEKKGLVLTAVGRVCEAKNYPMLLQAVALLNQKGVAFTLWIVGGGAEMDALAAMKERMGLENVVLWGSRENPYPYLAQADGYVCSSIYEGLSTTTIEALILGKACVVTDCTGMRDILGDSEYGLIVPIEAQALADGMERLLTDEALRARYEQKALIRAQQYAPERCMEEIEKLFI